MNSLFLKLDKKKQKKIINASLHVFSLNDYKHALTDDIAWEAQISKGSLFQYFKNKISLYIFLYNFALEQLGEKVNEEFNFKEQDFFELVNQNLLLKIKLYKTYPYLYQFVIKANEEKNPDIAQAIDEINQKTESIYLEQIYKNVDFNKFKEGTDIEFLIKMIDWCSNGVWTEGLKNQSSVDVMYQQVIKIINLFKQAVYKQEYL